MSPLPTVPNYDFCSIYSSKEAREPLHATATRADVWLSLEYTGRWGARAFGESDLPESIKEHVGSFTETTPNARIQFIARSGNYTPDPIHFYVSVARLPRPRLYAFRLESYEGLLDLDLDAICTDDEAYEEHLSDEKLFFVCNNGLRDACCAKFGIPVHAAMEQEAGEQVWRCTHIGGHRLAPNLLFLPHALSYGRVAPEDAPELVQSYRHDRILLRRFRGRTIYDRPLQAADHFVRRETDDTGVDAFHPLSVEQEHDRWRITMAGADGAHHRLLIEARRYERLVYKTCFSEEPSPVEHFYLLEHSEATV
ncbi:MAG TPA: sucrase ferredoxin [Candidatus Sulfomarinibacteraceae bacterium]|nr:sucrase ferredoxin [Candidatus Sulfomarinibacteraceae bacterium]